MSKIVIPRNLQDAGVDHDIVGQIAKRLKISQKKVLVELPDAIDSGVPVNVTDLTAYLRPTARACTPPAPASVHEDSTAPMPGGNSETQNDRPPKGDTPLNARASAGGPRTDWGDIDAPASPAESGSWGNIDMSEAAGPVLPEPGEYLGGLADAAIYDKGDVLYLSVQWHLAGLDVHPESDLYTLASRTPEDPDHAARLKEGRRFLFDLRAATGAVVEGDPFKLPSRIIGTQATLKVAHRTKSGEVDLVVRAITPPSVDAD